MIRKWHFLLVLSAGLLFYTNDINATIYTWIDEKGVTHYSQTKPNEVRVAEKIQVQQSNAFAFEKTKHNSSVNTGGSASKKAATSKTSKKSSDKCWSQGNSLGLLLAAADGLSGREKAEYVKIISEQKRALEKECGKNSNAWGN